jgi:hypothetical protein
MPCCALRRLQNSLSSQFHCHCWLYSWLEYSISVPHSSLSKRLTNNGITDCGLASATAVNALGTLSWTFTGSDPNCFLTIDRGYHYDVTTLPNPPFQSNYRIEATKVTLSYPYQWSFNRAITLVIPSANYANSPIQSVAVMQNLN